MYEVLLWWDDQRVREQQYKRGKREKIDDIKDDVYINLATRNCAGFVSGVCMRCCCGGMISEAGSNNRKERKGEKIGDFEDGVCVV